MPSKSPKCPQCGTVSKLTTFCSKSCKDLFFFNSTPNS